MILCPLCVLGMLQRGSDDALSKIEAMIRGAQGAVQQHPVAAAVEPVQAIEQTRTEPPPPARGAWDNTTDSLLVLPEPEQQSRPPQAQEPKQPYRTYVDNSTAKKMFLGSDYNVSMEETMLQEAVKEKAHWLQCLDAYTNMEPVGTEYNESRMILSETAVVWIKVILVIPITSKLIDTIIYVHNSIALITTL